ncbi:MAG: T9SS type A sorting domain-containing protein [Bacteroidetes bacterium]|nr:T9SS type A sorting domain-containing protein [Bacteroidota bacterium]
MKIAYKLLFILLLLAVNRYSNAQTAAGGDITYEWVSDSTYRIYVTIYRDCAGGREPASVPVCFYNPCNPSMNFSITASKSPRTDTNTYFGCARIKTQCDSINSALPGFRKWIYLQTTTLPGRCDSWHIYTYLNYRSNSNNIVNATAKPFYLETRFNNTGSYKENSSPFFSISPLIYWYPNAPISVNNAALDADGDSVVTEIVSPLTDVSSCSDTVPSNTSFPSTTPALSIPSNPLQTNNTLTINNHTGQINFTPTAVGRNTLTIKVKEYRNGVLIGSVMRENMIVLYGKKPDTPKFKISPAIPSAGYFQTCVNSPISFSWDVVAIDTNTTLALSDNHIFTMPGATITYSAQGKDSIRGTLTWTPAIGDTGTRNFISVTLDSTCSTAGFYSRYLNRVPVVVYGPPASMKDSSICPGDTAGYTLSNTGSYTWSILPGGTPGSISCTGCNNPKMYPAVSTQYVATSTYNALCPTYFDTVQVSVRTNISYPSIHITATPDTNITPGLQVTFTATSANCTNSKYQWKINNVNAAMGPSLTTTTLQDGDIVTCQLICNDTCPSPKDTISNPLTIHVSSGINTIKTSSPFSIYPNPNNGSFTIVGKVQTNNTTIELLDITGKQMYTKQIATRNGEINEQLQLDLRPGIYILKIDNQAMRLVIE